jgi:glucose-6-phosphate 1-dehydrogenase
MKDGFRNPGERLIRRRIVDPILKAEIPHFTYEPNSWGPREDSRLRPVGGWDEPEDEELEDFRIVKRFESPVMASR